MTAISQEGSFALEHFSRWCILSPSLGRHGQLAVSIGRGPASSGEKTHDEKSTRRGYHGTVYTK